MAPVLKRQISRNLHCKTRKSPDCRDAISNAHVLLGNLFPPTAGLRQRRGKSVVIHRQSCMQFRIVRLSKIYFGRKEVALSRVYYAI